MMKKLFVYASVIGLSIGIGLWLYKKTKFNGTESNPNRNDTPKDVPDFQDEEITSNVNVAEEMYQAKEENSQAIFERHSEADKILKESYSNIMENFVEDFSEKTVINEKDAKQKDIIDNESVSIMKEIDSISNDLDNL